MPAPVFYRSVPHGYFVQALHEPRVLMRRAKPTALRARGLLRALASSRGGRPGGFCVALSRSSARMVGSARRVVQALRDRRMDGTHDKGRVEATCVERL